tara:strand:+ start:406 stop:573 length:168 start_codon:yes stop_codon:yes gene_type:complete
MHLNGLLFLPILSCKKKIGPLELNFISKKIRSINGELTIKKNKENNKSKNFFVNL